MTTIRYELDEGIATLTFDAPLIAAQRDQRPMADDQFLDGQELPHDGIPARPR